MRKTMTILAASAAALLGGQALAAPPNPASCPALEKRETTDGDRKTPIAIPRQFAEVARSTRERIAVSTLGGGIQCIDTRYMNIAADFGLSSDGRFFSFRWDAHEAYGYVLIDRTGRGQQVDTGYRPTFSPSHMRFAAMDVTMAAFGALNGFGVWQVNPTGFQRLAFIEQFPEMEDWRLDGWAGENCINLSAIRLGSYPANAKDLPRVPRVRYVARPAGSTWRVTPARAGCPKA